MTLILRSCSSPLSSSFNSSTNVIAISPVSGLHLKSIDLLSKSLTGLSFNTPVRTVTVKTSTEIKGTGLDSGDYVSESDDEKLFAEFPLDSKLQQKLEHKMRMKLAKKIRLRNKKLVRKRRIRKRGQWPPSKANKLKNV